MCRYSSIPNEPNHRLNYSDRIGRKEIGRIHINVVRGACDLPGGESYYRGRSAANRVNIIASRRARVSR